MNEKLWIFNTTVPLEIFKRFENDAGVRGADANNLFINADSILGISPYQLTLNGEITFPMAYCSWIKGIFSVAHLLHSNNLLAGFIAVELGDCANSKVMAYLIENFSKVIRFLYFEEKKLLQRELEKFANLFQFSFSELTERWEERNNLRQSLKKAQATYTEGVANFDDFFVAFLTASDPLYFKDDQLKTVKIAVENSLPATGKRIAFLGVPPIQSDLWQVLKERDLIVCYFETPEEFALFKEADSIVEQYLLFTYPASYQFRYQEVKKQLKTREIEGIIFYSQDFCYREGEKVLWQELADELKIPFVHIQHDKPGPTSAQTILRIEAALT